MDPLQEYVLKLVALAQEALALHRQGQALPGKLADLAEEALELDVALKRVVAPSPEPAVATMIDPVVTPPPSLYIDSEIIVLDVEEEADGGPELIHPALVNTLPPLVVDVAKVSEPVDGESRAAEEPERIPEASPAPGNCARCGTPVRQGKRFCHRCGAPI
jgi:hypothetical protein